MASALENEKTGGAGYFRWQGLPAAIDARRRRQGGAQRSHDPVARLRHASARRGIRLGQPEGQPERMIHELPDSSTTKYQDDVL